MVINWPVNGAFQGILLWRMASGSLTMFYQKRKGFRSQFMLQLNFMLEAVSFYSFILLSLSSLFNVSKGFARGNEYNRSFEGIVKRISPNKRCQATRHQRTRAFDVHFRPLSALPTFIHCQR